MNNAEMTAAGRRFRSLKVKIRELEAEAAKLKDALTGEMDSRCLDELVIGENTFRWKPHEQKRFDSDALARDLPEIAEMYSKKSVVLRFTVT